ncbi:MAG TPA: hypothetical protein VMH04_20015 [Candidatus Solibacter sp.]|nr:hypothetical protein [Candidatus Solibacter sp.]
MGLFDAFRKDEVVGTKVLVCALGGDFEELRKNDERIYKRFYPTTITQTAQTVDELKKAIGDKPDVVHLLCAVDAQGALSDSSGGRLPGAELLQAAVEAGVKVLWIASDNFADPYNAGFKAKGQKINVILTERRLGPNFSLFLDSLLTKTAAGEQFAKAWTVVSNPVGKSVQPDVPHTITSLGRGAVVLK